ncbi:CKLF-like MARVEL transmembrane domain-containing protein 3 [Pristis pectinata]|uniref:CKLF-like MARVEL transmembrane domain-containing protein 3 n=1 Tax=Pristis pectinata TaxID=685728 RepID=UPI00223CF370|nr:CKLF-like MARVEL transmembrane domain-containing protein 3 [Pristis pectinata]
MPEVEVNSLFLKSRRSVLKILEMVVSFVTFVCFAASSSSGTFLAVPLMEIFITLAFYLLYLLKLDSKITLLFWPLMDSVNSIFAALFLLIICIVALALRTTAGVIAASVFGFLGAIIYVVDTYVICKLITFNQSKSTSR